MHYSTVLALTSAIGLTAATPLTSRAIPQFPAGTSWDIVLQRATKNYKLADYQNAAGSVIDIDLVDSNTAGIDLKALAQKKKVICYFSAGSREDWRPDAGQFAKSDYGAVLQGWKGENWVNVKSDNVFAIMKKRIELAASSGCNAVDPDNVDGYDGNQDGFGYPKSAYVTYFKKLADVAKANNMAIGLKNSIDMIPDVLSVVQFAVNEQCHERIDGADPECPEYKPFTDANKAVFNIEYNNKDCSNPNGVKLSTVLKSSDQALDTLGGQCK